MPETPAATAAIDNQFAADKRSRSRPHEYLLCAVVHRIALLEEAEQLFPKLNPPGPWRKDLSASVCQHSRASPQTTTELFKHSLKLDFGH
jgi:hypothetical protein